MRRLFYLKKFNEVTSKKQSWKSINQFLNRNQNESPIKIIDDEGRTIKGCTLVEKFNSYFTNIGNNIAASFPNFIDFNYLL